MKRKSFKLVSCLLILGVLLAGCSKTPQTPIQSTATGISTGSPFNAPGTFPILKEKVTLKFAIQQAPTVQDYATNKYTKLLADRVGINFDFVLLPADGSQAKQKLAVMINANDKLPDVICMELNDTEIYQYGSQGAFIPLNDYFDKSSYYIKQYMDKGDATARLPLFTSSDGKVYTVPEISESITNDWSKKAWINKTWLDKLGMKVPTTTEEFYDTLKAFKTKDPNGNGKADEIPFVGSSNGWTQQPYIYLMNPFIYSNFDNYYLLAENGNLDVAYNKPEWKMGLEYMTKLCSEGLLSPLSFSQNGDQFKALIENGDVNIIGGVTANSWSIYPATSKKKLDLTPLPPLKGPEGKQYATYANMALPNNKVYITRDCKNPEAAFKLADYMWSEEATVFQRYGERGVDWTEASPTDKVFNENAKYKIKPILVWGVVQNSHWQSNNAQRSNYDLMTEVWDGNVTSNTYNLFKATELYVNKAPKETVLKIIYTQDELSQIADIQTSLKTYVDESLAAFVTGNKKISEWDNYVKELDRIGLKKYLEISQKAYSRMKNK